MQPQVQQPHLVEDGDRNGKCCACVGHVHNAGQSALTGAARQEQVHLCMQARRVMSAYLIGIIFFKPMPVPVCS